MYSCLIVSGSILSCWANQTICTTAKLTETSNPSNEIYARGCGTPGDYYPGTPSPTHPGDYYSGTTYPPPTLRIIIQVHLPPPTLGIIIQVHLSPSHLGDYYPGTSTPWENYPDIPPHLLPNKYYPGIPLPLGIINQVPPPMTIVIEVNDFS